MNAYIEKLVYNDGKLYAGSLANPHLFRFDIDDLGADDQTESDKMSEDHNAGTHNIIGLCVSKSEDRIYGCLSAQAGTATGGGGIGYWDIDDLEFKKSELFSDVAFSNDCFVGDDHVWFTSSFNGQVLVCDLDLTDCEVVTSDSSLSPINQWGANGILYMDDYLIVANAERGTLVKIPVKDGKLDGSIANVNINDPDNVVAGGPDGLIKVDDDIIVIVTPNNCILLESDDDFVSADVKKSVSLEGIDAGGATTGTIKSDDLDEIEIYVIYPGWESYSGSRGQELFKMALVKFSDEDVDDLSDFSLVLGVAMLLLWG